MRLCMFSFSSGLRTVSSTEKALNADSCYYYRYSKVLWVVLTEVTKGNLQNLSLHRDHKLYGWHMESTQKEHEQLRTVSTIHLDATAAGQNASEWFREALNSR